MTDHDAQDQVCSCGKQGYWFRLDGRDLVVRALHLECTSSVKDYRITQQKIEEVQDAALINENE
jgi:hypothetical protein